ncbi:MAG TPA: hypothetical protein VMI73_15925 [Trebonia sp.]|nr:hypothetical protein [Trebonia sp.]
MTVGGAASLRSLITRSDRHPALVPESGAVLTYAGLQRALDRAAGRLAALGVREGDRVALTAELGDLRVSRLLHDGVTSAVAAAARSDVPASVIGMTDGLLHIDGAAGEAVEAASPGVLAARPRSRSSGVSRERRRSVTIRRRC